MMETILILAALFIGSVYLMSRAVDNGVGSVGGALRQIGLFVLKKNPPGLVDVFDDRAGSGSRTWMNFGMVWLTLAGIFGFLDGWHRYDPTALDSLASVGWSYDDGSALRDATGNVLRMALMFGLVGASLVAVSRNGNGRLASEANASLVAVLLSAVLVAQFLLPAIFGFADIDTEANPFRTILLSLETLVLGLLFIPVLVNVLLTVSTREQEDLSTSSWFLIMGILVHIMAMMAMFFGELADADQVAWFGERVATGWVPLALMFAVGYHVVPMAAQVPIWSGTLRSASMFFLFLTVPALSLTSVDASGFMTNLAAILVTLGILPVLAGSVNIVMTGMKGLASVVENPGAIAGLFAFLLLPFFVVGTYFTGMDAFVGTGELGSMAHTVNMGLLFTVGGLLTLAGVYANYPLAVGKPLANSSSLSTWFVAVGGVSATVAYLIGDFTKNAVMNSGVEDAVSADGGFYLTGSALFYFVGIGAILASMTVIRTGIAPAKKSMDMTSAQAMSSYTLTAGSTTTIRNLIGRGVGVDTELVVSETTTKIGGSTVIAVDAALHNDEVKEFPVKASDALVSFVQYLTNSGQSVMDVFMAMDIDHSGRVDSDEFLAALVKTEIKELTVMDAEALVAGMDLDGDGQLNLPELDIAIAQIKRDHNITPQEEE